MDFLREHLPDWHDSRFAPGLFGLGTALSLIMLLNSL
jgi:hypothetical protein